MTGSIAVEHRPALADRALHALVNSLRGPSRRVLASLLRDPATRAWIVHALSDQVAMREATFESDMPRHLERVQGFEDCAWLFSSNELNHGLARLRLDEAAYLYRLAAATNGGRVVELGTYKGGSTFLLASAGVDVLTLDNGKLPGRERFAPDLLRAVARVGLGDRVRVENADARTYEVEPESFDLVFFDCMYSYVTTKTIFERWWPGVRRGGALLFRDGKQSLLTEAVRYVSELRPEALGASTDPEAPGSFVLFRKS